MSKKADGADTDKQENMMEKIYHGHEGFNSILVQLMAGKEPFAAMFDQHELENNREGNELRSQSGENTMQELKQLFHRHSGARYLIHEGGLSFEALSEGQKKGSQLTGRNINDRAGRVLHNYKFALGAYKEYMAGQTGNQDNPSGLKVEDMMLYVQAKMYAELKGKTNAKNKGKEPKKGTPRMKPVYAFNGMFAFLLFGPNPLSGQTLSCFTEDGKTNIDKKGRKASREEETRDKKKTRETGAGGHIPAAYNRGVNIKEKAAAAHMALSAQHHDQKNVQNLLALATAKYKNLLQELGMVNGMVKDSYDTDESDELKSWRSKLRVQLDSARSKIASLETESENMRKQADKKQVTAFYEQVGSFVPATVVKKSSSTAASPLTVESTTTKRKKSTSSVSSSALTVTQTPAINLLGEEDDDEDEEVVDGQYDSDSAA